MSQESDTYRRTVLKGLGALGAAGLTAGVSAAIPSAADSLVVGLDRAIAPSDGEKLVRDVTPAGPVVNHRNDALNIVTLSLSGTSPKQRTWSTDQFRALVAETGKGVRFHVRPGIETSSVTVQYRIGDGSTQTAELTEKGRQFKTVLPNVGDGLLAFSFVFETGDETIESATAYHEIGAKPPRVTPDTVPTTLLDHDEVVYVEKPVEVTTAVAPNDPKYGDQYAPAAVNATDAWDTTLGSTDATVAVVDTGADYEHPDLAAQFPSDPGYDFAADDEDPMPDTQAHGTHVSGIAAGTTGNDTGIAGISNSELVNARVLGSRGYGTSVDVADGIQWAADQGADIINLSLGGGPNETKQRAIEYADEAGSLIVAAAGNDSQNIDESPLLPASSERVVTVSALNPDDELADNDVWGSNYGSAVDLAAPGVNVLSTVLDESYETYSGTSMATPVVSGVAGLIKDRFPEFTKPELRARLRSTATDIDLHPDAQGAGKVDAEAAVAPADFPATDSPVQSTRLVRGAGRGLAASQYHVESVDLPDSGDAQFAARLTDVAEVDSAGSISTTVDSGSTPQDPPAAPTESLDAPSYLSEFYRSATAVVIDWRGVASESLDHYNVYVDGELRKQTPISKGYVGGLTPATSYDITVTAVNNAGEESPASSALTLQTESENDSDESPVAPSDLQVLATTATSTVVDFDSTYTSETTVGEFRVTVDGETAVNVAVDYQDQYPNPVVIPNLSPGTTYDVSVTAVAMNGQQAESASVSVTTAAELDEAAPGVPSNLTVTGTTASSASLAWDPATDDDGALVDEYVVFADGSPVALVEETTATVTDLTADQSYDFAVAAIDDSGNRSETSASVTATASAAGSGDQVSGEDWTATLTEPSDGELQFTFDHDTDATWVDLHYTVNGGLQLNVRMNNQGGSHTYLVDGLSAGDAVDYWFTYQEDGLAYDTSEYNYEYAGQNETTTASGVVGVLASDEAGNEALVGYDRGEGVVTVDATGSQATVTNTANVSLPCWVAVDKNGSELSARVSSDGASWTDLGTLALDGGAASSVGLAATAGEAGELLEASVSDVLYDGLEKDGTDAWGLVNGTNNSSDAQLRLQDTQYELEGGDGQSKYLKSPDGSFALQPLADDAWTSARVVDIENHTQNTAGGVGIRAGDGNDTVAIEVDRDGTVTMVKEADANTRNRYSTAIASVDAVGAPVSVALRRAGDTVHGYYATDGSTWEHVGTTTLVADEHLGGLYARSGETGWTATVTFEDVVVNDEFDSQDVGSVEVPGELTLD